MAMLGAAEAAEAVVQDMAFVTNITFRRAIKW